MKLPLNFGWAFALGFKDEYLSSLTGLNQIVDLPHNMVPFSFNYFDEKDFDQVGTYAKEINVKEIKPFSKFILKFEGVNNSFSVYLNGILIGNYSRPYMEVDVDITLAIKEGRNYIVVKVDGSNKINVPPFGYTVDYFPFSGIYREVSLYVYNYIELETAKIDARANGEIKIEPKIHNPSNAKYSIEYEIYEDKKLLMSSKKPQFVVNNPHLWSISDPYLYFLRIILRDESGKALNHYGYSFGFRDIKFLKEGFYLNNQLTALVGLNRHETFPYLGGAAPAYLQFSDVVALKKLGVNYVRCSHYPPSSHFLNACDFLGLLVVNETPGWQYIGDESWKKAHLANIETMINRDYNHPCVISWSIRINESQDDDDLYTKGQNLAKSLDPYRPTTGTRNFANSNPLEDIYSFNDFSHHGDNKGLLPKRKVTKTDKPYMVSENNGHMCPTKPYDDPLHQISHVKRHLKVLDAFFKDKDIAGISPWCMHDYYTYDNFGSGDHICYHGVLDIFRNPKPAAYVYRANFSAEPLIYPLIAGNNGDLPENHPIPTLVLSNASYLVLHKDGVFIKKYFPFTKAYPYLPNPPFVIDTIVTGESLITSIAFSKKERSKVAAALNHAAFYNFDRLKLKHKISLGLLMLKYKLKYADIVMLWNDNLAPESEKVGTYTLTGYDASNHEIAKVKLENSKTTSYNFVLAKDELINGDTYDVTTLTVESFSNGRNVYDFSPVHIETSGPIALLGPATQGLHAGSLTLYFRCLNGSGSATITLSVHNTKKSFNLSVK